ncbi:MAG: aldolase/citrate lyase family protein [Desulfatiglandaceae bacterium]
MQMVNKLKKVLEKGEVALGTAIFSCSPAIVEVAGYGGLDFVRIDNEYSWRRDESMEHMIRAAYVAEITPILRIDKGDHYLVNKALEIGAGGVLVPDISRKEEVEELIKATKFPPRGTRGYSSLCFSGQWGARSGKDWVNWCDSEILVGIMIENEEVITRLDEILSIEGLDFVFFGPSDYSMSLGLRGPQKNHPKVQDALKKTIEVASRYKKSVAIGVGQPWEEEAKKYIDLGCRIIEIGHDVVVLRSIWKGLSTAIRNI